MKIFHEQIVPAYLVRDTGQIAFWCHYGHREGCEWVARNPRRADRRKGSFKVNISTGRWGDFSTGDYGGDLVALAAYLFSLSQRLIKLILASD